MYVFDSYSPAWAILGGFGLLLFGIRYLSETLQRVAGPRFKRILEYGLATRSAGVAVGTLLTSLLQSETIAALLTITFVNSGLVSFYQSVAVLLGTAIGTTIAIQFIAVVRTPVTFLLILLGVAAKYFCRRRQLVATGDLFLGIGFVTLGLSVMESGFSSLSGILTDTGVVAQVGSHQWLAFLAGLFLTLLLQSGSATMAIILALVQSSVLTSESAWIMLAGELSGGAVMAMIAALLGTPTARLAAGVYLVLSSGLTALFLIFLPQVRLLTAILTNTTGGQLLTAHLLFTAGAALLICPFIGLIVRWVLSWSRNRKSVIDMDFRPTFLDERIIATPGIALTQTRDEALRMATLCQSMLREFDGLLYRHDAKKVDRLQQQVRVVKVLHQEITEFLSKLAVNLIDAEQRGEFTRLLGAVNNLALAGEAFSTMLQSLIRKKELKVQFSTAAMSDVKMLTATLRELFDLLLQPGDALIAADREATCRHHHAAIAQLASEAMARHLERLAVGKCTVPGALIYNDLLAALERFAERIVNAFAEQERLT